MANANYHRGRRWEWAVSKDQKSKGRLVTRSAASKGLWDLTVVHPDGTVWLIQCKTTEDPNGGSWKDENWFTLLRESRNWTATTLPVAYVRRLRGGTEVYGPYGRIDP